MALTLEDSESVRIPSSTLWKSHMTMESMKIHENPWKSMKIHENPWKSTMYMVELPTESF